MRHSALAGGISRVVAIVALLLTAGALPWLSRRDPAASVLRARYAEREPTPEALQAVREELGLGDGPLATSLRWWSGAARGDLGTSWVSGAEIAPGAVRAFGVSMSLAGLSVVVALVIAGLLVAPACRRTLRDQPQRSAGVVGVALTALPEFLLASLLLVVVAVQLQWLPPYGWGSWDTAILPALALGIPAGGLLGRLLGDAVAGVSAERWVETWRLAEARPGIIMRGVLRRALATVIDQVGLVFIGILGGAVAVEQVFAIPGIGRYLLGSANAQDLPALQAGVLFMALAAAVIGCLAGWVRKLLLGGPLPPGAIPAPPEARNDRRRGIVTAAVALLAIAAILVAGLPRDPYSITHTRLAAPSAELLFGADASGRDLLARVAHGTVGTLLPSFAIIAVTLALSLLLATLGEVARGPAEIANATPPILAGVIIAALAGPSVGGAALAVLWVTWPPLTTHAAALIDEALAQPHIRWLPLSGASRMEIWLRHVLPSVVGPLVRHGLLRLPGVALTLASLGFLGLGAQPPAPEWGLLLAEGIDYVERAPWTTLAPAFALILTSVAAVALASLRPNDSVTGETRPNLK